MSIDGLGPIAVLALALSACATPWIGSIHACMAYSENGGVRVVGVPPGPALSAGLALDDRITAIDGHHVDGRTQAEVLELLHGSVGSRVTLTVLRAGVERELTVLRVPGERSNVCTRIPRAHEEEAEDAGQAASP